MKPINRIKPGWSGNIAYLVGLITTDGSLSKDGRHIVLVSKDKGLLEAIRKNFGLTIIIGSKFSTYTKRKNCYTLQIGDIIFYRWLVKIGITPNKTKTINALKIPDKYFFDFLRGHFDGDGCFYSYWDPRWKSSFMYYLDFASASQNHIIWLHKRINKLLKIAGHFNRSGGIFHIRFAKKESQKIINKFYQDRDLICLERKYKKIMKALVQDK